MRERAGRRRGGNAVSDHRRAPEGTVPCPECGASIPEGDEECPSCGARPWAEREGGLLDQYPTSVWVLSLVVAFLTYRIAREIMFFASPLGLAVLPFAPVVPAYFVLKARGDEPVEQSRIEVAAVLVLNVVGVVAVEGWGEGGARFVLGVFTAMTVMGLILFMVFLLGAVA